MSSICATSRISPNPADQIPKAAFSKTSQPSCITLPSSRQGCAAAMQSANSALLNCEMELTGLLPATGCPTLSNSFSKLPPENYLPLHTTEIHFPSLSARIFGPLGQFL